MGIGTTAKWLTCVAVWTAAVAVARGGDWPQWGRTNSRNMVSEERGLPDSFTLDDRHAPPADAPPINGTVRWEVRLGSQTYGNPTVAGGRVFVGTNDASLSDPRLRRSGGGLLMCIEEATGRLLWRLHCPRRIERERPDLGLDRMKLGICSSPTVDGDRLYVVSNRAEVLCLDVRGMADGNDGPFTDEAAYMTGEADPRCRLRLTDGDILWRRDLVADRVSWPHDAANSAVLVCGELLYVCTSNGMDRKHRHVPFPDAPSLIALDKRTGRILAGDDRRIGTRLLGGQWSSPAMGRVAGRPLILFGGGDGVCYGFRPPSASGNGPPAPLPLAWAFDCNPPDYRERDGRPVRYRSSTGPSEIIATPVFHDGRVYVATGQDPRHGKGRGALSCIDATTGRAVWVNRDVNRSLSTVAIDGGLLYLADLAGTLHCIEAATGRSCWTHDLGCPVWSSPLVADGKVYIGTAGRRLWILRAGRAKQVIHCIRLPDPMYNSPVAANGVLYLATQRRLFAVQRTRHLAAGKPESPGRFHRALILKGHKDPRR